MYNVYGILNNAVNGEEEDSLTFQVYDIEKAFDKLWAKDSFNDLVDSIPEAKRNDKISLLFEANRTTKVAVKTPFGKTERIDFEEITQQGGSWGPTLCSNSLDKVGKKTITQNKHIYVYKETTRIPPLFYIDDLFDVSKVELKQ